MPVGDWCLPKFYTANRFPHSTRTVPHKSQGPFLFSCYGWLYILQLYFIHLMHLWWHLAGVPLCRLTSVENVFVSFESRGDDLKLHYCLWPPLSRFSLHVFCDVRTRNVVRGHHQERRAIDSNIIRGFNPSFLNHFIIWRTLEVTFMASGAAANNCDTIKLMFWNVAYLAYIWLHVCTIWWNYFK